MLVHRCVPTNVRPVALQPNPAISKLYTKDFHLAYVVTLSEHELSTDIHVSNPASSETLDFQALLHTYIRAPANEVSITPLLGKRYVDKTEKSPEARSTLKKEERTAVDVRTLTDSVYEDTPTQINVVWPEGGLALKLSGFTTLTIWNPQEEVGSKIGDMEEKGWQVVSATVALMFPNETHVPGSDSSVLNLGMCVGSRNWDRERHGLDNKCLWSISIE